MTEWFFRLLLFNIITGWRGSREVVDCSVSVLCGIRKLKIDLCGMHTFRVRGVRARR